MRSELASPTLGVLVGLGGVDMPANFPAPRLSIKLLRVGESTWTCMVYGQDFVENGDQELEHKLLTFPT
jgi:hypothetical protein